MPTRKRARLDLDSIRDEDPSRHAAAWEKALRKLSTRQMPPAGKPRPDESTCEAAIAGIAASLDAAASAHPDPGPPPAFRRLSRTEYQNAIRDLLALDIDTASLLPPDEASHGFRQYECRTATAGPARTLHFGCRKNQPSGRGCAGP
jgi:hypothetical protein